MFGDDCPLQCSDCIVIKHITIISLNTMALCPPDCLLDYNTSTWRGREWLSGRVLDFGPGGPGFEYRAVPESYCIFVNIYHTSCSYVMYAFVCCFRLY